MNIAIQGYEGSFHHIAALRYFGPDREIVSCPTFRDVAFRVEQGEAPYGVMAIENSIAGSIMPNYRILQNPHLQVAGEVYLPIQQNLMALPGMDLAQIEEVHSHPMALLQCMDYLDEHPTWTLVETADTAWSARHLAETESRKSAAIASTLAAQLYGLEILAPAINTIHPNYTRFLILKQADPHVATEGDKASLYFKTRHCRGALLQVLRQLEDSSINLSKLQSYPIPSEPWHYLFHVDMEFEAIEDYFQAVKKMEQVVEEMHIYGVYKKAAHDDPRT
ncbi:MAG: prephenate dehydratase [Verrucomicrobiota bacterium]|nr:prephenate dehydratase [Verrucomicrobiota bacterium]